GFYLRGTRVATGTRAFGATLSGHSSRATTASAQAQHAPVGGLIHRTRGEVVKGAVGHADDVIGDELRTLARAVLRVLQAAFPFQHRPAAEVVLRHLREHGAEVHLPVSQRAEAPGAVDPTLEAAVHALLAGRVE